MLNLKETVLFLPIGFIKDTYKNLVRELKKELAPYFSHPLVSFPKHEKKLYKVKI